MFGRKGKDKIKKMDVLITSIVLGTIIAGAFGLKKKKIEGEPAVWKKILRIFLGK